MSASESGFSQTASKVPLRRYLALMRTRPELFVNSPSGIDVLLTLPDIKAVQSQARRRLRVAGNPTEWGTVGVVHEDEYLLILRDAVRFPDGETGTYVRLVEKKGDAPGAVVFPVLDGSIVLTSFPTRHALMALGSATWLRCSRASSRGNRPPGVGGGTGCDSYWAVRVRNAPSQHRTHRWWR